MRECGCGGNGGNGRKDPSIEFSGILALMKNSAALRWNSARNFLKHVLYVKCRYYAYSQKNVTRDKIDNLDEYPLFYCRGAVTQKCEICG